MSVTNRILCDSSDCFDLYLAIQKGKITFSTDRHIVLLDYDVDNMGISSIVEASIDPVNPGAHGTLHYNTGNGKIYFSNGDEFVHIGTVLERDGINVISKGIKVAPDSAVDGDQYLISSRPDTAWRQHKNQIAKFDGLSWEFTVPEVGEICGVENEFIDYRYDGYAWSPQIKTPWIVATPQEDYNIEDNGEVITVLFGNEPGVVSSSSSGTPGVAFFVSRSDHSHDLGNHPHADNTSGGRISHAALLSIEPNSHHNQIHSGLDHTGIIGTWAQINFTGSSIGDIANRSHALLTEVGLNSHSQIDSFITNHDHDGINSKEVKIIDGGDFNN